MKSLSNALAQRLPFYYGWVVTVTVGLAIIPTVAFRPGIIGLLYPPMQDHFGWSRSSLGVAVFIGSGLVVIAAPVAGRLVDRYGAWLVLNIGTVLMGVCLIGLGTVSDLWAFYVLFGIGYASFAGINRVSITSAMAHWFLERRGRAMGIVALMLGLGFVIVPPVTERVLSSSGWQASWYTVGLITLLLALPSGILLFRNSPDSLGQSIDGKNVQQSISCSLNQPKDSEIQWTFSEAIRTKTLWMLVASVSLVEMSRNGVGIHMIAHMTERGMSPAFAAIAFSIAGITMIPMSIILGIVVDKFGARFAYGIASSSVLIMGVLVIVADSNMIAIPIGITMGIGSGGVDMVMRVIFANYFGRASSGAVIGMVTPFIVISLGVGALISGIFYDLQGDYYLVFWGWISITALAIAILTIIPSPSKMNMQASK